MNSCRTYATQLTTRSFFFAGLSILLSASGCVGNVSSIQITRLHAVAIPPQNQFSAVAQGGQALPVTSASRSLSKTAIGGDFQQRASTSNNYRLSGGFGYGH